MELQRLGNSGLDVSDLGLGTVEWGRRVDADTAQTLLDDYIGAGGNLVELSGSAPSAAETIGTLKQPEQMLVMARVGVSGCETAHSDGRRHPERTLGRGHLLTQVDGLLRTLQRGHIDILVLDHFDATVDPAETASAVTTLLTLGKIRYFAVSHYSGWQLMVLKGAGIPVAAVLTEYSLLQRNAETEVWPAADYAGIGVIAGAGLGRGVLSDKYCSAIPQDSRLAGDLGDQVRSYLGEASAGIMAGVRQAAAGLGAHPVDLALAFNRYHGVAATLVSPRTPAQLGQLLDSDLVLEPEIAEVLDQIS